MQVHKNLPVQICDDVHTDLTIPRSVEPLVSRANKQKVSVLLLKTLLHVDIDGHKGKMCPGELFREVSQLTVNFRGIDKDIVPKNPTPQGSRGL